MRSLIILLMVSGLFSQCSNYHTEVSRTGYELTGDIENLPAKTWIILKNNGTGQVDSVLTNDGQFTFKGILPDSMPSANFMVRTKDWSDYRFLWMENAKISFKADYKNFRNGKVTGSNTQLEADKLIALERSYYKKIDSLKVMIDSPQTDEKLRGDLVTESSRIYDESVTASRQFVIDNFNSIVSAHHLDVYATSWGKQTTSDLYEKFSDDVKKSVYGKKIFQYLAKSREPQIGDFAVDFEQNDPEGKKIRLSDFRGKVVLLEFWASWCGPCRKANPGLVKVYKEYHGKGFEILGVSLDDKKHLWTKAIANDGLLWPQVSELNYDQNSASLMYGVSGIPDNFLIDTSGTIIGRHLSGDELHEKLKSLFELSASR